MKNKIIYVTFEGLFSSAFDSQVLTLSRNLINKNYKPIDFKLFVFSPLSNIFERKYWLKRKKVRIDLKNNCYFAYEFKLLYIFPKLFKLSLYLNSVICFFIFFFGLRIKKRQKIVFHCRGQFASYIFLKLKENFYKNSKVFCDTRSIVSVEALNYYHMPKKRKSLAKQFEKIENYVEKNSDYLSCVSDGFKKYLLDKNRGENLNLAVIPNCIDEEKFFYDYDIRNKVRDSMGIDNEQFVVLYSGSLSGWQIPERIIKIFKILNRYLKKSIIVIITNKVDYANELFKSLEVKKELYKVFNTSFENIGKFLTIGDLGLLIRESNVISDVARPIKFAEYIRSGVPVLINDTLKDIVGMVKKYDLGFVINDCFNNKSIEKVSYEISKKADLIRSDRYKRKISEIIGEKMSWGPYLEKILCIYDSLFS